MCSASLFSSTLCQAVGKADAKNGATDDLSTKVPTVAAQDSDEHGALPMTRSLSTKTFDSFEETLLTEWQPEADRKSDQDGDLAMTQSRSLKTFDPFASAFSTEVQIETTWGSDEDGYLPMARSESLKTFDSFEDTLLTDGQPRSARDGDQDGNVPMMRSHSLRTFDFFEETFSTEGRSETAQDSDQDGDLPMTRSPSLGTYDSTDADFSREGQAETAQDGNLDGNSPVTPSPWTCAPQWKTPTWSTPHPRLPEPEKPEPGAKHVEARQLPDFAFHAFSRPAGCPAAPPDAWRRMASSPGPALRNPMGRNPFRRRVNTARAGWHCKPPPLQCGPLPQAGLEPGPATARGSSGCQGRGRTTVVLQNLPLNYRRPMVQRMLEDEGFAQLYDFIYMPLDFATRTSLGYAFVNLVDPAVVPRFRSVFEGYHKWIFGCQKVCHVRWGAPLQGLEAHIDHFRNSRLMHRSVPDEYKPALFSGGACIPFPTPTKQLKAPSPKALARGGRRNWRGRGV